MGRLGGPAIYVLLIPAVIAVVGVVGVATAAVPGSDGKISGCDAKVGGILRVTDTGKNPPQTCTKRETAISWNPKGPAGPTGAP